MAKWTTRPNLLEDSLMNGNRSKTRVNLSYFNISSRPECCGDLMIEQAQHGHQPISLSKLLKRPLRPRFTIHASTLMSHPRISTLGRGVSSNQEDSSFI